MSLANTLEKGNFLSAWVAGSPGNRVQELGLLSSN